MDRTEISAWAHPLFWREEVTMTVFCFGANFRLFLSIPTCNKAH
jgi:hypothetical protein